MGSGGNLRAALGTKPSSTHKQPTGTQLLTSRKGRTLTLNWVKCPVLSWGKEWSRTTWLETAQSLWRCPRYLLDLGQANNVKLEKKKKAKLRWSWEAGGRVSRGEQEGSLGCEMPGDMEQEERATCQANTKREEWLCQLCLAFPHLSNGTVPLPNGEEKHPRALTCFSKHIILASPNLASANSHHLPSGPPLHIETFTGWKPKAGTMMFGLIINIVKSKLISLICHIKNLQNLYVLHIQIGKYVYGHWANKQKIWDWTQAQYSSSAQRVERWPHHVDRPDEDGEHSKFPQTEAKLTPEERGQDSAWAGPWC